MCRVREMEMFVRAVETGSFSAHRTRIKVGQPAISKMIRGMRKQAGSTSLNSINPPAIANRSGPTFYERALRTPKTDCPAMRDADLFD